jgi:hypothetical protein
VTRRGIGPGSYALTRVPVPATPVPGLAYRSRDYPTIDVSLRTRSPRSVALVGPTGTRHVLKRGQNRASNRAKNVATAVLKSEPGQKGVR